MLSWDPPERSERRIQPEGRGRKIRAVAPTVRPVLSSGLQSSLPHPGAVRRTPPRSLARPACAALLLATLGGCRMSAPGDAGGDGAPVRGGTLQLIGSS